MLKQYFSTNVNRTVRSYRMQIGQIARSLGLAFFIEGFALYAVSLRASAMFLVEVALATAHARSERSFGGCPPAIAHREGGLPPSKGSDVVAPELAAGGELRPARRGNGISELGDKLVAPWTHSRREREIRGAIAALAKYDERTLRDLGMQGRADIERMVRYCRDC